MLLLCAFSSVQEYSVGSSVCSGSAELQTELQAELWVQDPQAIGLNC